MRVAQFRFMIIRLSLKLNAEWLPYKARLVVKFNLSFFIGRSPPLRHYTNEDDSRRFAKFSRSPSSNTSSSRASLQDEEISEDSRRQLLPDEQIHSSPRSVITYAADNKASMTVPKEEKHETKEPTFEDNINNNSSKMDDDDCLTLQVPMYVKSVVILQNGKRFRVDLTETN